MSTAAEVGIEFARKCIGWTNATYDSGEVVRNGEGEIDRFNPDSWESAWPSIREFLGNRYWIQMNRDRATDARWRVAIGVQDVARRGASRESVEIIDDNQTRAIMSACLLASEQLSVGETPC